MQQGDTENSKKKVRLVFYKEDSYCNTEKSSKGASSNPDSREEITAIQFRQDDGPEIC